MNIIEAHGQFATRPDAGLSVLPEQCGPATIDGVDPTPALATALCELSGMLPDATSEGDLNAAAKHGCSLLAAGIITLDQWNQTTLEVIQAVLNWGEAREALTLAN